MRNDINVVKASYLCYGCGTCNVVCGHQAITMQYDNIGRLQPIIDETKCVNCGLCINHCPSMDIKGIQLPGTEDNFIGRVENVYIGKANDETIYKNSQSGGLVTATVKYLFESGKIDAAIMCKVEDDIEYTHKAVVITSADELYSCQKSSYVPIDIVSALKEAKNYNAIAVVGTGCHIQGIKALKNFSKIYNEKIKYTLGLICDRTLCKTATDVLYGDIFKGATKRIIWRDKSLNYYDARVLIKTTSNLTKQVPTWKRHALKEPFTNPRCRICFDKLNTGADIVFGDPWGMNNVDWAGGMSVVISRSHGGAIILKEMEHQLLVNLHEAPIDEVLKGQHIDKRRKDVSSALAYYLRKRWLVPSYAVTLNPAGENHQLNALIDKFVEDCLQSKEAIIIRNSKYLKRIGIKSLLYNVFKQPVSVICKIIK